MIVVEQLVWDEWNLAHIARHGVTQEAVEEVCHHSYLVLDGKKGRLLIVGTTLKGRLVAIILDPEPELGVYYPVTARSADKKERRRYRQEQGGIHEKAA